MCARSFFARSPFILLILVLLLRCCHSVSCTNLGLENFARILGHLLANWKQHASCMHNSHKSPRSICEFILNHHGCCRCRCRVVAASFDEVWGLRAPLGLLVQRWHAIARGELFALLELVSPPQSCTMSP